MIKGLVGDTASTRTSLFTVAFDTTLGRPAASKNPMSRGVGCRAALAAVLTVSAALIASGCGGGSSTTGTNAGGGSGGGGSSPSQVFLIVEENHSYSEVIGNTSMPYLNGLASKYGLATQYYANVHPSIGNYFMLTVGEIETNNDSFNGMITDDNIVRELVKANKTWRSYAESLPSAGYTGGDVYPYLRHHNPFTYFSDVVGTSQAGNVVPFSQFSSDLASGNLPDFGFIVPNALDDAHDGTLAAADQWLQTNIDPLVSSSEFQKSGLLIIVFDESVLSDSANGGGHVAAVIAGPNVKPAYQSVTFYQHQSTLRLVLSNLGMSSFPGNAATAPEMTEFFK
jgi:phosphatidylinositol-3-phosphatase